MRRGVRFQRAPHRHRRRRVAPLPLPPTNPIPDVGASWTHRAGLSRVRRAACLVRQASWWPPLAPSSASFSRSRRAPHAPPRSSSHSHAAHAPSAHSLQVYHKPLTWACSPKILTAIVVMACAGTVEVRLWLRAPPATRASHPVAPVARAHGNDVMSMSHVAAPGHLRSHIYCGRSHSGHLRRSDPPLPQPQDASRCQCRPAPAATRCASHPTPPSPLACRREACEGQVVKERMPCATQTVRRRGQWGGEWAWGEE